MFGPSVDAAIMAKARQTDEEICGVIINGAPVFLPNVAEDRQNNFRIRELPDDAEAIFHSHPGGPFEPSEHDLRQQYATALPWAIACFDGGKEAVIWFGADNETHKQQDRDF